MKICVVGIFLVALTCISLHVEGNGVRVTDIDHRKLVVDEYDAYDALIDSRSDKETKNHNPGFTGKGGVDMCTNLDNKVCWIQWTVEGGGGGPATLSFWYSLKKEEPRYQNLFVNGVMKQSNVQFVSTGSWMNFEVKKVDATLEPGKNYIKMKNSSRDGPTYDRLVVEVQSTPVGGYCGDQCSSSSECDKDDCSACVSNQCGRTCWDPCFTNSQCASSPDGCTECRNQRCKEPLVIGCFDPCTDNGDCSEGDCSLCRTVFSDQKMCVPDCDEPCISNNDCRGDKCKECVGGQCKPPALCRLGEIKKYRWGSFSKGPTCIPTHKPGTVTVGSSKCEEGYERYGQPRVTSENRASVRCGLHNDQNVVNRGYWYSPWNKKDCRAVIPYCEHHCINAGKCEWEIWEKCTEPYG